MQVGLRENILQKHLSIGADFLTSGVSRLSQEHKKLLLKEMWENGMELVWVNGR